MVHRQKEERNRDRIVAALSKQPNSKLDLIEAEVHRLRDLMGRKVGTTYTRATILVGAAGLLGSVGATASVASGFVVLGLAGLGCYAVAAALGLIAFRPLAGAEVDVDDAVVGSIEMDDLTLRRSFIISHLDAHAEYERSIKNRVAWVRAGFIALGLAWLLTTLGTTLGVLNTNAPSPIHVVIDNQP